MKKGKNILILILLLLAGFVIGGLIAQLSKNSAAVSWLSYGTSIGINPSNPVYIDLAFLEFSFGFVIKLNVSELLCMVASLLVYRKIA